MKKFLFSIATVALCLFLSCKESTSTTSTSSANTSATDSGLANTKAVFKGIETGDLSVMDSIVAVDAVDHGGPYGDINGRDSIKKYLADMHNHITNLKLDVVASAANGDYDFVLSRMSGVVKDNSMGMHPGPIDHLSVGVVRNENGKAKEHWLFINHSDIVKMMHEMHPADSSKMKKK